MENPGDLIDALATAIRAIPGVLTLLNGDANNVVAWVHEYPNQANADQALMQLEAPAVLVTHLRTVFGRHTEHQFSLILRPRGSAHDLFKAIRDGIPTGYGGVPFNRNDRIQSKVGIPVFTQYFPRTLLIGAEGGLLEIHEAVLSLFERGIDA